MRRFLFRAHIWLGWIVGLQLLFWTLSGVVMTAMPIEAVRGEHLRAPVAAPPLAAATGLVAPETLLARAGADGDTLTLRWLAGRPVWELRGTGQPARLFDARSGAPFVLDAALMSALARARYAGTGRLVAVEPVDPAAPPLEFRRDTPAWVARFDDAEATRFYLDAGTGELLAVRTRRWRLFDLMWGLHIMDLKGREDMNHPLLVGMAGLALASVLGGLVLLGWRALPRRRRC
jgi:uncharacterized iron-regulated membrane protein